MPRQPIPRSQLLRPLALLILPALLIAACAGSASAPTSGSDGGERPAPSMAPAAPDQEGNGSGAGSGQGDGSTTYDPNRKIVYTGSLDLEVADVSAAIAKGRTAVVAVGGWIGASSETNNGDYHSATITYRIPAQQWDTTLAALRGVGDTVLNEETQATEVGDQIVDLEARLRNLRASEEVLLNIAKSTGKVTDLLEVQARLTEVRGEIERLDAQRAHLEGQVAYGTLVTTYQSKVVAVEEQAKGWDPGKDVDGAVATLIGVGQAIVSFLIWFGIVWLPVLAVLAVVALGLRFGWRRLSPRLSSGAGAGAGTGAARTPRDPGPIAGWGSGFTTPPADAGETTRVEDDQSKG